MQTNNPGSFPSHGGSPTPTEVSYNTIRYGVGRLDMWLRTSTIRAGERGTLTFRLDNTSQWLNAGPDNIQWFDGVAHSCQINRDSSMAVGVRRVTGDPPIPTAAATASASARTSRSPITSGSRTKKSTSPTAIPTRSRPCRKRSSK